MINQDNAVYLFALTQIKGIKPPDVIKITCTFPTLDSFTNSNNSDDQKKKIVAAKRSFEELHTEFLLHLSKSREIIARQFKDSVNITTLIDDDYPRLLRTIANPPILLYFKGDISILNRLNCVAVIGTRNASQIGIRNASIIAHEFAKRGFVVVSGLAKGIDTAAHSGALEGGYTAAVLGAPLNKIYPAENRTLAEQITRKGVILSELANGQDSYRGNFVQRDRIQSGLSVGVIPVQTDIEGGTMHTVNFAIEQERMLFCPKPPDNEAHFRQYSGISGLIRDNKAKEFRYDQIQEVADELNQYRYRLSDNSILAESQLEHQVKKVSKPKTNKKAERELNIPLFSDNLNPQELETIAKSMHDVGYDSDPILFEQVVNQLRRTFFPDKKN